MNTIRRRLVGASVALVAIPTALATAAMTSSAATVPLPGAALPAPVGLGSISDLGTNLLGAMPAPDTSVIPRAQLKLDGAVATMFEYRSGGGLTCLGFNAAAKAPTECTPQVAQGFTSTVSGNPSRPLAWGRAPEGSSTVILTFASTTVSAPVYAAGGKGPGFYAITFPASALTGFDLTAQDADGHSLASEHVADLTGDILHDRTR